MPKMNTGLGRLPVPTGESSRIDSRTARPSMGPLSYMASDALWLREVMISGQVAIKRGHQCGRESANQSDHGLSMCRSYAQLGGGQYTSDARSQCGSAPTKSHRDQRDLCR